MVFRFLLRYLSNNEQLVQRLSESYPIRRAAQLAVLFFNHGKSIAQDTQLHQKLTPEQFRNLMRQFSDKAQQEFLKAQERLRKRKF